MRLEKENQQENKKIMREVLTLSRLHHKHIVRYYQAWVEGGASSSAGDSSPSSVSGGMDDTSCSESSINCTRYRPICFLLRCVHGFIFCCVMPSLQGMSELGMLELGGKNWGELGDIGLRSEDGVLRGAAGEHVSEDEVERHALNGQMGRMISRQYLYIQMEFCTKTLSELIRGEILGEDENQVWRLLRQICEGLAHIHKNAVIHRDLKPSNIFIDSIGDVKIGDFGLATGGGGVVSEEEIAAADVIKTSTLHRSNTADLIGSDMTAGVGTAIYTAPELYIFARRYDEKVDIYSLGIILFEMLHPFSTEMERIHTLR